MKTEACSNDQGVRYGNQANATPGNIHALGVDERTCSPQKTYDGTTNATTVQIEMKECSNYEYKMPFLW